MKVGIIGLGVVGLSFASVLGSKGISVIGMESDFQNPVNLGNPKEFSIKGLADIIINTTKSQSKIRYESLPIDDPKKRRPDISRAKKMLDWEAKIDLAEGIKRTYTYMASEHKVIKE